MSYSELLLNTSLTADNEAFKKCPSHLLQMALEGEGAQHRCLRWAVCISGL